MEGTTNRPHAPRSLGAPDSTVAPVAFPHGLAIPARPGDGGFAAGTERDGQKANRKSSTSAISPRWVVPSTGPVCFLSIFRSEI